MGTEEWNSMAGPARPPGWPNESEQVRTLLWQQEMTELINTQTRVLVEIRDILIEEQITIEEMLGDSK